MRSRAPTLAVLLLCCTAWPAAADTLTFGFDDQRDARDWRSTDGVWKVRKRAYGPRQTQEATLTVSLLNAQDFDRRTPFARLDGLGRLGVLEQGTSAGLVFRGRLKGADLSGYMVLVQNFGKDAKSVVRLLRLDDYDLTSYTGTAKALCREDIEISGRKTFGFEADGSRLKVYYGGELKCSAVDATYPSGAIGLAGLTSSGSRPSFSGVEFTFEK